MKRIGQVRASRSTGQIEKWIVIGVGGVLVLLTQLPPFAGLRASAGRAQSRPAAVATAVGTPLPTSAPLEAVAPAAPTDEAPPAAEPPRTALVDPPTYRVSSGGAGANLRGAPSTTAPVLKQVADGAAVT